MNVRRSSSRATTYRQHACGPYSDVVSLRNQNKLGKGEDSTARLLATVQAASIYERVKLYRGPKSVLECSSR